MGSVLAEILGLWDEPRHARRMMEELAAQVVRPEHRALVEAGSCGVESRDDGMENWTRTVCRFETPCGAPVEGFVYFQPITGAVSDVWDLAHAVQEACPEMLTAEALPLAVANAHRGLGPE